MKGLVTTMYGYGYPGYGYGYGYGSGAYWIIIVILLIFFVLFWGNGCNQNRCNSCNR